MMTISKRGTFLAGWRRAISQLVQKFEIIREVGRGNMTADAATAGERIHKDPLKHK